MTEHRRPGCHRTRGLVDRVVDDRVTADDRAHAATCDACGPVIARAVRFDDALRRSARDLVTEQLPHGVLDPDIAPSRVAGVLPMRHAAPGMASIFAAVVVVMIATAVAVAPGGLGPGTQPPDSLGFQVGTFRSTADIATSVRVELDFDCTSGHALPTTGPSARLGEREGFICLTPKSIENAKAKIVPVENGDGEIVEITIAGELYGTDTLTSRDELAGVMARLTSLALADPGVAAAAGAFIEETLPRLQVLTSGDDALLIVGNVRVHLRRHIAGDYLLVLQPT